MTTANNFSRIILFLLCVFAAFSLFACAAAPEDSEIFDTAQGLIEKSVLLNRIYFGEEYEISPTGERVGNYVSVKLEGKDFTTTEQIKTATSEVFSEAWCEVLFRTGFEGAADSVAYREQSEGGALYSDAALGKEASIGKRTYARYIDGAHGLMELVGSEIYITSDREFDFSSMKILSKSAKEIKLEIESVSSGEKKTMQIYFVCENGKWKIDSPTY